MQASGRNISTRKQESNDARMLLIIIVLLAFILAVIANKGPQGIENKNLRGLYLVFIGFLIQIIIFNEKFVKSIFSKYTGIIYIISLVFLLTFLLLNLKYIGVRIISIGYLMNVLVITLNKGYMPQSSKALKMAGEIKKLSLLEKYGHYYNAVLMNNETHLNILGDKIFFPFLGKIGAVYSVGDLVIMAGIFVFIFELFKKPGGKTNKPRPVAKQK